MKKLFGLLSVLTLVFAFTLTSCDKDGEPQPTGVSEIDTIVYLADSIYSSNQEHYDSLILVYVQEIYGDDVEARIDSLEHVITEYQSYDRIISYTDYSDGSEHIIEYNENGTINTHTKTTYVEATRIDEIHTYEYLADGVTVNIYSETLSEQIGYTVVKHLYKTIVYEE